MVYSFLVLLAFNVGFALLSAIVTAIEVHVCVCVNILCLCGGEGVVGGGDSTGYLFSHCVCSVLAHIWREWCA